MADDEVEEMLRAAQDELILKLSVNSHTSRSSSDYLDPDLHSRFLALKSKKKDQSKPRSPSKSKSKDQLPRPRSASESKSKRAEEIETPDDLMRRFAALKPSPPPSASSVFVSGEIEEEGEDAEVEKLIQWAMDAARLDPSPPSDEDDDDDDDDDDSARHVSDDDDDSPRHVKP